MNVEDYARSRRPLIEAELERLLPSEEGPAATVARAMRYAVFGGGKRLRPILVLAACEACGGDATLVAGPAAALEMIHTYSLIHDDLPAMDDDDLRRGRATVHRAFDEATAILAGDGLLTLAFEVLASEPGGDHASARRCRAVAAAARGAGVDGMVGGQMADLEAERREVDADGLDWIHRHKTAALLAASVEIGSIHAGATERSIRALAEYGRALGLAFQVADDILDRTSTAETLGKTPGKDLAAGKATYPALFGLEASRGMADTLAARAIASLEPLGPQPVLEGLARFAAERSH